MNRRQLSPYEMTQLARHGQSASSFTADMPVEYATGIAEFCGLEFAVTPDVLIPRVETEGLVELALQAIAEKMLHENGRTLRILDVGTGSGTIIISLAKHLENSDTPFSLFACDISTTALAVAKSNAQKLVSTGIEFQESDLLATYTETFDLITANLPYIPSKNISQLETSVKDHEPLVALDGGNDGFGIIKRFLSQAVSRLSAQGTIILEVDQTHGPAFFKENENEFTISYYHDCFNRHRFVRLDLKN